MSPAGRVAPGAGRLDAEAYVLSLLAAGFKGDLVLDLRAVAEQERVASDTVAKWGADR